MLFGLNKVDSLNLVDRLPSYFTFSLVSEWRNNYKYYVILNDSLKTPFDNAAKKESEWYVYAKYLEKLVDLPILTESFSLRQIYIPTRAYYSIKNNDDTSTYEPDSTSNNTLNNYVVNLEDSLIEWINNGDKNDSLRIIKGGPGYGKSSFIKIFASNLIKLGKKVLLIPLHRFEIKEDLEIAILNFIKYDKIINYNPLNENRLIILFDGLDELSMQGLHLTEAANQFIREIEKKLSNYNHRNIKIQVIISGRDVIVEQNKNELRKDCQILTILPFYLNRIDKLNFIDKNNLLEVDQRKVWWQKYSIVKGLIYTDIPYELKKGELEDLTSQPLLNYLIALSFQRGKLDFSKSTNLNEIYYDLLEAVYYRNYAEGEIHHTIKKIDIVHFVRMLEEIAISSWHGNGRTTSVSDIEKHLLNSGLEKIFEAFIKNSEKGMVSLLAAFYFRQATTSNLGTPTFEFTHKSFGEYLTARRIMNTILQIQRKLDENDQNFDEGWNIKQCSLAWIKLFVIKEIDLDILRFVDNELKLLYNKNILTFNSCQVTIERLIEYTLKDGLPFENISPRPSYFQENIQSIHSEKALLALLGTITNISGVITKIKMEFYNFIRRLDITFNGSKNFPKRVYIKFYSSLKFRFGHFTH
ncbi:hypothetical protein H7U12_18210 [Rufibacter sp. H-1]|uniref:NACHT N-terminal Helical domain-containing protein n=2 Tax=Rufibacter sediminis TaxID=2762756 RepID=A0ABR6VXG4_9BACT|nr:hypothetical protein [Rufibacter sediminis]MBC3541635.1 hypothetical protein [Rufibacter sediminis]